MMSRDLQLAENELAATQPENVNASESAEYINVAGLDYLEGLLPSESEEELHAGNVVVDNYSYENTGANEHQIDNAAHCFTEASLRQPSTDDFVPTEGNCLDVPATHSSPKKPVPLPSEATLMVDGQKCVLRVDCNTGRLMACPVDGDTTPVALPAKRLQGRSKTNILLEARCKSMSECVNIVASEELDNGELSDCSLEISCSTVTQSASSPSEPDQENRALSDGVIRADEPESNDVLSDSSTVSAETVSAPSSSELEQENTAVQHVSSSTGQRRAKKSLAVAKDLSENCEMADITANESAVVHTDISNKDQIVISASNRVQNYLASLGLPVKRGRGRPRRRPLPPEELSSVMVLDGDSAVPLSDSELKPSLPLLLSNMAQPGPGETQTSIIIEQEDGTEKHIVLSTPQIATSDTASTDDTLQAQSTDRQNIMHVMMAPRREPVKIAMRASDVDLVRLKCQKCEFQALYAHQLQHHLLDEHADELADLIRCRCCNFLFFAEDDLKEHFKKNHPKNMCSDCGFMSEHMYVIRRHMQRHSMAGCECHVCGRRYKDQYILKMHIKMRHMEPEVLFQCNLCSKVFTRKAHLKRHLRIHNPDKPYKCPHCDYRGCERSDITKHILVHDQPQHACDICGKCFRHIKNKELHLKRHRGQRDYKCVFCDFYGYTYTDIRKHQERKHANPRTTCGRCCITFESEHMLKVHQQMDCQPVDGASDSEANDIADSSDVLHYVTDSDQLVATSSRPISSSSGYKVFVNGSSDGLHLLGAQISDSETMIDCDANIGLVPSVVEVPLNLLEH